MLVRSGQRSVHSGPANPNRSQHASYFEHTLALQAVVKRDAYLLQAGWQPQLRLLPRFPSQTTILACVASLHYALPFPVAAMTIVADAKPCARSTLPWIVAVRCVICLPASSATPPSTRGVSFVCLPRPPRHLQPSDGKPMAPLPPLGTPYPQIGRGSKRNGKPLPDICALELADLLKSHSGATMTALDISGTFELGCASQFSADTEAKRVPLTRALEALWEAITVHPALTSLGCRLAAPLTKTWARDRVTNLMQSPLLGRLFDGQLGRAAMPVLLPLPCGPVGDRKRMQTRFAAAATAVGPIDRLLTVPPTSPPAPPLFPAMKLALERSAGLRELHVQAPLDSAGARVLAAGLLSHSQCQGSVLSYLDLRFSRIGAAAGGLDALGAALAKMRVQELDLSFCEITRWPRGLSNFVQRDTHLHTLRLRCNKLRTRGVKALLDSLASHPSLTQLNLRKCFVQPPLWAAAALTRVGVVSPLRELDLRNNRIENRGVRALLSALAHRGSLDEEAITAMIGSSTDASADSDAGSTVHEEDRGLDRGDGGHDGECGDEDGGDEDGGDEDGGNEGGEEDGGSEGGDEGTRASAMRRDTGTAEHHASASTTDPPANAPHLGEASRSSLPVSSPPRLQFLSLRNVGLRSSGACAVAAWLVSEGARLLHTLHLDENDIGGYGARALALAIEQRGSGLPAGWFSSVDATSGRPYYFQRDIARNRAIGSAQWDSPSPGSQFHAGLRELGISCCVLHDKSLAAVLEALTVSRAAPPASLRIGGNTLNAKAAKALAALIERGGVAALDIKRSGLEQEGGRWLAPVADALQGQHPRRPRMRWPLNGLLFEGKAFGSNGHRALVEPLLSAGGAMAQVQVHASLRPHEQ